MICLKSTLLNGIFRQMARNRKLEGEQRPLYRVYRDENTRVFVFVRVQYFLKNPCSGEHERTPVFALYVFVFFHPWLQ